MELLKTLLTGIGKLILLLIEIVMRIAEHGLRLIVHLLQSINKTN